MKSRLISGVILVVLFLVVVFASPVPFVLNATVAMLGAAALYEVLIVTKYIEGKALMSISICFAIAIPFMPLLTRYAAEHGLPLRIANTFILMIFFYAMFLFVTLMSSKGKYSLEHLSVVFIMSVIIPSFFTTIVFANEYDCGMLNIILIFLCAWGTDTGGYLFGRLFGRKKFVPNISPKKTREGVIGALAASVSALMILGYCVDTISSDIKVNYIVLLVCAVAGGVCAILGDLIASLIKRSFGVKDFGSIIPGHGGIMDRFDSVLFTAPLIYLVITFSPIFEHI